MLQLGPYLHGILPAFQSFGHPEAQLGGHVVVVFFHAGLGLVRVYQSRMVG
jgi:hypothetical protein